MQRKNPYCEFRDDRERGKALFRRDIRLVLLAGIGALAQPTWHEVLLWLKSFL
jgi:hypothetical protein